MATINASTNEKVIPVRKWLGLNQAPDGDTNLKVGEASVMKNFKVTRDGNLKRRPGMKKIYGFANAYELVVTDTRTVTVTRGNDTIELFGTCTVNQSTGLIELSDSVGEVTGAEATALLDNAEPGQHYYYRFDDQASRVNTMQYYGSGSAVWFEWTGVLMSVEETGQDATRVWTWTGYAGGAEQFVAVCNGYLYALWDSANDDWYDEPELVGLVAYWAQGDDKIPTKVSFLPFENKLYILTDKEYFVWDGSHEYDEQDPDAHCKRVQGYDPLIATSLTPDANGAPGSYELTGEAVNRLTPRRRVWLSPDGTNKIFHLPEKNIVGVTRVTDLTTGEDVGIEDYSFDTTEGTLTFDSTPAEGVNSYEVQYQAYGVSLDPDSTYQKLRSQIVRNAYFELYSGKTDTIVFLYGDGTNKCIYSGMDYNGMPRADYFPDLNDIRIGDENTPITQLIRHNAALLAFKEDSAWAIQQDIITLADGNQTFGYYVSPVNKAVGNEAPGQVQLVDNDPITLHNNNIYRWVNSSYYSSNLTRDERQARRISDRVQTICNGFDFENTVMWDDNDHQELYISNQTDKTLVWNYAQDAWYEYDIAPYTFLNFHGTLYFCAGYAFLYEFDEDAETDDGEIINAQWVSGAMDFGVDYSRKYSSMLWVGLKAEEGTSVDVTVKTDRKDTFKEKVVPSYKAKVPGEPFMVKTKIKAKKFIYYRLILESAEKAPPVTVTAADIRVRMTGYAK